jgi:hypothetical protein
VTGPQCLAPSSSCAHHVIELPAPGRVDVVLDWISPLNGVALQLLAGRCPGDPSSCAARVVDVGPSESGAKPARASRENVPAGPYTLLVYNQGSGAEVVRYEVWMTP